MLVVKIPHFLVELAATFLDGFHIDNIVAVSADGFHMGYHRLDLFITEHRSYATAAGLFQPYLLTLYVIKCEVQHAYQRMIRGSSC